MTAAILALALSAAAAPQTTRERLEDGLEIIVHRLPAAPTASLRLVVRAGGSMDTRGKGGLAHVVEHCVMQGSYDVRGRTFLREARRAGAVVNAHTYAESTRFELDAPVEPFPRLAERFVRMVTSPAWERVDVQTELGVIRTESSIHDGEGLLSFVERALFPSAGRVDTLLGSSDSRETIRREDLTRFYERYYLPSNMTVVFAGKVSMAEAKGILARSVRLPPALPGERPPPLSEAPALPMEQRVPAGITVTVLGYHLARWERPSCEALAALVELRASRQLQIQRPLVSRVDAHCSRLRGQPFLLAFAYTRRLDAGDLPEEMDRVLLDASTQPPSAQERALVGGRLERRRQSTMSDPTRAAEALAEEAGEPRPGEATDLREVTQKTRPDPAGSTRLARESFVGDRRVLLHLTPLQD